MGTHCHCYRCYGASRGGLIPEVRAGELMGSGKRWARMEKKSQASVLFPLMTPCVSLPKATCLKDNLS